jgi:glucose/arabinose dehydrogenase/PKD repeat protein
MLLVTVISNRRSRRRGSPTGSERPLSGPIRALPIGPLGRLGLAALGCLLAMALLSPAARAITLPSGFSDQPVTKLSAITAFAFTPDGRILVTNQDGKLVVYKNGAQLATPAIDLTSRVCRDQERGLLGVAVDPAFSTSHRVFLYYTFKKAGNCNTGTGTDKPVNRVSSFVLGDNDVVSPTSEIILIDNIYSIGGIHNAGDLHFGKDGFLYVSVGDSGCDLDNTSDCGSKNNNARDESILNGKILRIVKDGSIPAGNPFQGADSARCNVAGHTDATKKCQETFAWGLRNPYRISFDPNAAGTRFFINDVGQNVWEEIDEAAAGADYGWNLREGHCKTGSSTDCPAPPSGMTDPVYDYNHSTGCTAITAGAFAPNGVWPAVYDNTYLYGDFVCGKIIRLTPKTGGGFTASDFATGMGNSSTVGMSFGPFGTTQALYYANRLNGGELRRIVFTGTGVNRAPTARASADKTFGPLPLTVTFDGSASSDPDNDALGYDWDFGDGTTHSTAQKPSHTYGTAGTFTVTLVVNDGKGGQDSETLRIDAGNSPPVPVIDAPLASKTFRVGEVLTLQGHATDPDQGTGNLSDNALSWVVIKHHNTHVHPFLPETVGNNVQIPPAPNPEDLDSVTTSYLEIQLTATDAKGLSATVTRNIFPNVVNLSFTTTPAGLRLEFNGLPFTTPKTVPSWENYGLSVNAPNQTSGGSAYSFASWSDGGAASHTIVTPATAASYSASFSATPVTSLFSDGFESGNLSAWTSAPGLVVQSQQVFAGSFAARATSTGSPAWAYKQLSAAQSELFYSMRFKVLSQGANNVSLGKLRTATGGPILAFYRGSSGKLGVLNETTATSRISTGVVSTGAWHLLTVHALINGSSGLTDIFLDGAKLSELSRTESLGTTPIGRVQLGDNQSSRSFDVAFDDVDVTAQAGGGGGGGGDTKTFPAAEDSRVQESTPTTNYGAFFLKAEGGVDPDIESYLKFDVVNLTGTVQSAKLRVFATSGTGNGPSVYTTSTGWTETGLIWNNRPAKSSPRDKKKTIAAGSFVEFDVTPFVTGNAPVAFVIATGSDDGVDFNSREAASNTPQLIVTTG